ncbi:mechanosensitive ion channel family protein [Caldinitratiruptor microaerophilus]|uniref:Small conductance mechanosensitive channel n=1 Tax=Caldinitratiruptor microaerophilus TaxID=671077 RepID=A0AA35G8Q9_9FIRM|nr:mechanosensitive ion channel family protein [Caldinitratiruptor microaerophilus]BDG61326.1 hypothetical protein caldi_24160 [Caldinitratiruptor microaerophilus]
MPESVHLLLARTAPVVVATLAGVVAVPWLLRRAVRRLGPRTHPAMGPALEATVPGVQIGIAVWGVGALLRRLGADLGPWVSVLAIAALSWAAVRVGGRAVEAFGEALRPAGALPSDQDRRLGTMVRVLRRLVEVTVGGVAALVILNRLDVDIRPILTAAGVGGVALGLGAQSLVRDLIGGFFILAEDQMRVGDVVKIGDASGVVEEIGLRTTVLRALDGTVHVIPNGQITTVSNLTKNWSRYLVDITVAYKEDVDRVMAVLRRVGEELAADPNFAPYILEPLQILGVDDFAASGVVIRVMWTTVPLKQWDVGREFRRRVKQAFDREGIEIPIPHLRLYVGEPGGRERDRPAGDGPAGR